MVQFEYFPVLIDAHRNDLRAMAQPLPSEVMLPARRHVIGRRLIRLGHWLAGTRPDAPSPLPAALGEPVGIA
jgi:hypothetical protein